MHDNIDCRILNSLLCCIHYDVIIIISISFACAFNELRILFKLLFSKIVMLIINDHLLMLVYSYV